jgi:transcription termination factor Rho
VLVAAEAAADATASLRELVEGVRGGPEAATLFVLLVDAPPEDETEWRRSAGSSVVASTADRSPERHVQLAMLALERAKRRVEEGEDVVVALDSITRLARAHRLARSGDEEADADPDEAAIQFAKRWFAAGRATAEAGSLTIVAAARKEPDLPLLRLLYDHVADCATSIYG